MLFLLTTILSDTFVPTFFIYHLTSTTDHSSYSNLDRINNNNINNNTIIIFIYLVFRSVLLRDQLMATQTATNGTGEVRLREKKVSTSAKQNGTARSGDIMSLSASTTESTPLETSTDETSTPATPRASTFEQAFFFGLSIDDAINSTENILELFYNACKYNHVDLVKRCVDEKRANINEPFNNDYPLCIAW